MFSAYAPLSLGFFLLVSSPIEEPVPCPAFDEPVPSQGSNVPDVIRVKLQDEWKPCLIFLTSSGLTWLGDSYPHPVLILTSDYQLIWHDAVFDLGGQIPEAGIPDSYYMATVTEQQAMAFFNHLDSISAFQDIGDAQRGITGGMRYSSLIVHEGERRIRLYSTWACSPAGSFHGLNHWGSIPPGMTFDDLMELEPEPEKNKRRHHVWTEAYTELLALIPNSSEWQTTDEFPGRGYSRGICTPQQLADAAARRAALQQEPEEPEGEQGGEGSGQ